MGGGHANLFTRDIHKAISVAQENEDQCIPVVIAESWGGNLDLLACKHVIYLPINPNQTEKVEAMLYDAVTELPTHLRNSKNEKVFNPLLATMSALREESSGSVIARPSINTLKDKILCGDAFATLSTIPDSSVQCIVTSPPYFRQRDYGTGTYQVGSEDNHDEYVQKLVEVFRECRRVLKPDGLLWLNLGDKFLDGTLLGLPWRVAIALQQSGWILRCDIIWHKPNAMPHSVKTRPTVDHEYVFMFSIICRLFL